MPCRAPTNTVVEGFSLWDCERTKLESDSTQGIIWTSFTNEASSECNDADNLLPLTSSCGWRFCSSKRPCLRGLGNTWRVDPWCLPRPRTPDTGIPWAERCSPDQATPLLRLQTLRRPGSEFARRCPKEHRRGKSWSSRKIQGRQRKLSGEEILQHLWDLNENIIIE